MCNPPKIEYNLSSKWSNLLKIQGSKRLCEVARENDDAVGDRVVEAMSGGEPIFEIFHLDRQHPIPFEDEILRSEPHVVSNVQV